MTQHDTLTLEPCPFCGRHVEHVSRADNHSATGKTYIVSCFCGGYSACAHQQEDTLEEVVAAWNRRAALSATQPAQAAQPVSRDVIRDVFLRNGFTIKDGCSDLKPYVYAAANALLEVAAAQPAPVVPEGWEIREEATWVYFKRPDGFYQAVTPNDSHQSHAQTLHMLMRAMLAATPTPPAQAAADVLDAQRWQLRCETLRALFPSAPSDYELDAAINAAIAASKKGPQ